MFLQAVCKLYISTEEQISENI